MTTSTNSYGLTPVFLMNWIAINKKNPDGSFKYKYIINTGSSRSSKTWSIMECLYQIGIKGEGNRNTAWRDTKTDCKKTVWKDWQKMLIMSGRIDYAKRNKTESIYNFSETDTFEIHGTDDEETVHGLTQNTAWLNEPYKISKYTFDQIDQRSDRVIMDWNPKKSHYIEQISKQDNAKVIYSTYKDNPFCPPNQRIKIESYQSVKFSKIGQLLGDKAFDYNTKDNPNKFPEADLIELIRCLKNERQGSADDYMWQVYGLGLKSEKPNKIFTDWKRMPINEFLALSYPSYYGLDFGLTNPSALCEVKYNDGTFYFNELLYKPEKEMANGLVAELDRVGIDKSIPIVCDSASPQKILELRRGGYNARGAFKGKGSVFSGISLIQRANIYYTDTSSNLESEYDEYEWRTDRVGVLDEPEKANDHILDGTRYACSYIQHKLRIVL